MHISKYPYSDTVFSFRHWRDFMRLSCRAFLDTSVLMVFFFIIQVIRMDNVQINSDICVACMCFSVVKCILVASPGFVKDQFISYLFKEAVRQDCKLLLENRSKFMVVHSSSGHKYSLKGQYSVQLSKVKLCKTSIID